MKITHVKEYNQDFKTSVEFDLSKRKRLHEGGIKGQSYPSVVGGSGVDNPVTQVVEKEGWGIWI